MKKTIIVFIGIFTLLTTTLVSAQISQDVKPKNYLNLQWKQVATRMPDEWYGSDEAKMVADSVLKYQTEIGGWPKNSGFHKGAVNQEEMARIKSNGIGATFDNGATITEMMFLAKVYSKIKDERYRSAFMKGFGYILQAQYQNGGWPQFFPFRTGKSIAYASHITYNDNAMVNVMTLLRDIVDGKELYTPMQISGEMKAKAKNSFDKGVECILKTQIIVNGKPTVWCAQHDEFTLAPANARAYELASFSGAESVGITMLLMDKENPSKEIIDAVNSSVKWFENHKIEGVRLNPIINKDGEKDLVVVEDKRAPTQWARFYDLETEEPYFCDRDGIKRKTFAELGYNRRNGYGWYTDAPEKLIKKYPEWAKKWGIETSIIYTQSSFAVSKTVILSPANKAITVNPDTHLELTFPGVPALGNSGQIRIYDASDNRLVDVLDLSIPAGPTTRDTTKNAIYTPVPYEYVSGHFTNANTKPGTPSGVALPTSDKYQLTIIGGFTDAFHFYPVIIHGNTVTIYPHNNLLEYGKSYSVQIDPGVLTMSDGSFKGFSGKDGWNFTTKKSSPATNPDRLVVSADGTGDFNTVQGAIDFIPDNHPNRIMVYIKNGKYEEIVYFRNKSNITILGENRDSVIVFYKNCEVFNPHPTNLKTNELPGTSPSRRAAFAADHCNGIHLVNLTIKTTEEKAQAEGLLLNGSENIVYNVTIVGSGDALQTNGSAYYKNCSIDGWGDVILGRGSAFFKDCELSSSDAAFMWIRNTSANHGNVFDNCKFFMTTEGKETVIARAPTNSGKNYPFCEAVILNCKLSGISPAGWGPIGGDTSNAHYWEYNSTNLSDGKPVDISQRYPASRQLTMGKDSAIIANYSNPAFVLGDWTPGMAPLILSQPEAVIQKKGEKAVFNVKVAAIPEASYQWFKNDNPISKETNSILHIETVNANDTGRYRVAIKNSSGIITSQEATLTE